MADWLGVRERGTDAMVARMRMLIVARARCRSRESTGSEESRVRRGGGRVASGRAGGGRLGGSGWSAEVQGWARGAVGVRCAVGGAE